MQRCPLHNTVVSQKRHKFMIKFLIVSSSPSRWIQVVNMDIWFKAEWLTHYLLDVHIVAIHIRTSEMSYADQPNHLIVQQSLKRASIWNRKCNQEVIDTLQWVILFNGNYKCLARIITFILYTVWYQIMKLYLLIFI